MLAAAVRHALPRIYVPNSNSNTVDVIDPATRRVVDRFAVGGLPQHVVPAWNLKTLYVTNDTGNSLTPIDPRTGKPGKQIPVEDPYNMYFTPNGRYAIVVAERLHRLDFRDAHTFKLHHSLSVPCAGIDHIDFSADGSYLLASCEFSGQMVKVDVRRERIAGVLDLPDGAAGMPQDVKLSADGRIFYVADMHANGLWEIDGARLKIVHFLPHRRRRPRALPEPGRQVPLRVEPRRGIRLGDQLPDAEGRCKVADPRRRKPRHGRRLGRRKGALAERPLQRRRVCDLDRERQAAREDPGGERPARTLRLAAARPLLARTHRDPSLRGSHRMTFVDPGAIGECEARTQGASIAVAIGATEDAASRRRARPGDTTLIL